MNDRELLELAAQAAGIVVDMSRDGFVRCYFTEPTNGLRRFTEWNPLDDDGDALRLAVKLRFEIYYGDDEGEAVFVKVLNESSKPRYVCEPLHDYHYAATRRAIVRAAAEIGKAM